MVLPPPNRFYALTLREGQQRAGGAAWARFGAAPGHVFLLGGERDEAADSRAPRVAAGLAEVRVADVVGRRFYFSRRPGTAKAGEAIAG
ncbi:MAG TPA: hypothetical protein VGB79_06750 [Allosphingosinicella sp.]|jgi:hypothetical protein